MKAYGNAVHGGGWANEGGILLPSGPRQIRQLRKSERDWESNPPFPRVDLANDKPLPSAWEIAAKRKRNRTQVRHDVATEDLVRAYKSGLTVSEIAQRHGMSAPAVTGRLVKAGEYCGRVNWTAQAERYEAGMSMSQLAEDLRLSLTSVAKGLREAGAAIRGRGGQFQGWGQPKACEACGKTFGQREGEPAYNYRRRLTCSLTCRSEVVRKRNVARGKCANGEHAPCVVCGAEITRQPGERSDAYARKITCSEECRRAQTAKTRKARQEGR